jgi:hypothetical protein
MNPRWLTVEQKARQLGYNVGHTRKYCGEWAKSGKAKFVKGGGRRSHWRIDPSATIARTVLNSSSDGSRPQFNLRERLVMGWLTIAQTAHRLGLPTSRVRKMFPEWAKHGLAKIVKSDKHRARFLIDPYVRPLPEQIDTTEASGAHPPAQALILMVVPPGSEEAARSLLNALSKDVRGRI